MRLNVYHEELTRETKIVEKHVPETGKTYYGFRIFLKSAPELHHTEDDDDRSAITFWYGDKLDCEMLAHYWTAGSRGVRTPMIGHTPYVPGTRIDEVTSEMGPERVA
jgi:hypothetical protein